MSSTDTIERLRFTITGVRTVGLTGGTFQNVLLTQAWQQQLAERALRCSPIAWSCRTTVAWLSAGRSSPG